jgi:alanine racemase
MSRSYHISTIAKAVGAEFTAHEKYTEISSLLTDSRLKSDPKTSLFIAIKGVLHDGHDSIPELYSRGFRHFLVSSIPTGVMPDANFLKVNDTLAAFQRLASYHRAQMNAKVLAVTGSNGKTVVKEWLSLLFNDDFRVVKSPKSYNSQVGVPLSVWQMESFDTLGIFEAGISEPGEMDKLKPIIEPDIGIFTNIGHAHADNFKNIAEKADEKAKLFVNCDTVIYCSDYAQIERAMLALPTKEIWNWSRKDETAVLYISSVEANDGGSLIKGVYEGETIKIQIRFADKASIENAIHCWLTMILLGVSQEKIEQRMLALRAVPMRLELLDGIGDCTIINDVYSSDLGSLEIALELVRQQKQHDKITLILSDILQSGLPDDALYRQMGELIANYKPDRLIAIGQGMAAHRDYFELSEKYFYPSTEDFLADFSATTFDRETILVKGARRFMFEKISKRLQHLDHETVMEIDLRAVVQNLNYFRAQLDENTKLMAVVKAFSYGSGGFGMANVLEFNRVDYLAVAYADEGVELREAGTTLPIMVMNPETQGYSTMIAHGLEPEIYSFKVLKGFEQALRRAGIDTAYPVHIKIDTGMHRLGFEADDIAELIARLQDEKRMKIQSVFSHLSGADAPEHDDFTHQQIALFDALSTQIAAGLDYPILRHILNSSGISRFPEAQFDMVRLGIGMYGISSDPAVQKDLLVVTTLKTVISQIKAVKPGETIGYDRRGKADKEMRIATLAIGYADGLNRLFSNGKGRVMINGKSAPIVGNICMDMCMINVTGIAAKTGDEVIIFGEAIPIAELAKTLGTIPYEVLTGISRRVKRVYFQE